ncbi:DUF4230 domain-containing protein [Candidatus Ruminimicrobium bovinum]|uniref:DUF4230 domain-containing protein n=1 Tax=Candidatus Ruminimicrobium bovinum TaxID=3242779 RepID=UPI0039B9B3CB
MEKKIYLVIITLLFCIVCAFSFITVKNFINEKKEKLSVNKEAKVNIEYLNNQIKNIGYLITSEVQYGGLVEYETNGNNNPIYKYFISKKFLMLYDAEINAGIDLTLVELNELKTSKNENKIVVKMPYPTIKTFNVNPKKFYDLKKSWIEFGETDKEAMNNAKLYAGNDARNNIDFNKLFSNAQKQAEIIIGNLIRAGMTDKKYNIEFEIIDNNTDKNQNNIKF